ncbi:MAG: GAF domain-containing protein, partial [Leptospiraceae bacterium]|nr:GAF domain-containing protein [Leptospiraceae bacterium]
MVNLSLKEGNHYLSPFAFSTFGLIQGSGLGDFKIGNELGKLGIELVSQLGEKSKQIECRTNFIFAAMISHWTSHAKIGKQYFLKSIHSGQETGDFQYTSYSINLKHFQMYLMRENIQLLIESFEKYSLVIRNLKQQDAGLMSSLFQQAAINLLGQEENNLELKGALFNEDKSVPELQIAKNSNILYTYYMLKSSINYLLGDVSKANELSLLAIPHEGGVFGMMYIPEQVFFDSLICAKLYFVSDDAKKKKEFTKRILKNLKRMKKWAENCEANYGHKFFIIQGLKEKIEGNTQKALLSFKKAIQLAKEHEYILEEAIANELSAEIWEKNGDEGYSYYHLKEAYYAYKIWGCIPKTKLMEEKYPDLVRNNSKYDPTKESISMKISTSDVGTMLDLNTVLKASQTISGEIHLGKLLQRMLTILFENAGAERGIFVLFDDNKWLVQAEGNSNQGEMEILKSKPLEESGSILSTAIVNYVIRTKNLILLDDASSKGMFVNDSYIASNRSKSVLCYPILSKGTLVGIVYLENNLTSNAFTPDRLEILKVLSSQIAVSIENSLLYSNLEEKVAIRTNDLNQALVEVRTLKEQQDGDYFLTTLLIEPLAQNNATSKNLSIDFFLKQKKKFMYRKNEYELGGDINISENIELMNRPYIAFLNADAMGKSIQGAGGVLVLGTVFKSIIQRTILTQYGKTIYPERWIKNAFIEMHKVFESFDGSMLMSVTFGLIDDTTGIMYFIAAEHPKVILYRDSKASFVDNNNQFKKLGTQGQKGTISIEVFPLLE